MPAEPGADGDEIPCSVGLGRRCGKRLESGKGKRGCAGPQKKAAIDGVEGRGAFRFHSKLFGNKALDSLFRHVNLEQLMA